MNKSKFVVARIANNDVLSNYKVYVSDIIGNNGFSAHIEDAMKFSEFQADTIKQALETIENIHSQMFDEIGAKISYAVEEV
jgi:hypothetical protein